MTFFNVDYKFSYFSNTLIETMTRMVAKTPEVTIVIYECKSINMKK